VTRSRLLFLYAPALLLLALGVAACGSTGAPSGTVTNAGSPAPSGPSPALEFAKCMRAHGVSNFPDPGGSGGVQIQGTGLPQSPAFQTAQRVCQKYLPNDGQPHAMSEANRVRAVAFSKCMRTHGEPDFPDPLLGTPSGSTLVFSLRGMQFAAGPGLNPGSPAFRQAAADCGLQLPPAGAKVPAP
jgi:hypothetical protein